MPTLVKGPTLGDLVKYEAYPAYNREVITLLAGTSYPLGAVLGKVTATGKHRLSPNALVAGAEGAETASAVLVEAVDATAADKPGVVVARGPVMLSRAELRFDSTVNDAAKRAAKEAQLAVPGLVVRTTV